MAGKFGIVQNTPTEPSQLFAGDYKALANKTVKAGEGAAIKRGSIMCEGGDGTYRVLDLDTAVGAEALCSATGALTSFTAMLASGKLVPGTVKVKSTVGAAAKSVTDDGNGRFSDAQHSGCVDYGSGRLEIRFNTPPDNGTDIVADYSHGGVNDKADAVLAAAEPVDATSDIVAPMCMQGMVRSADLVWPESITDVQKARVLIMLRNAGIIVV
ncbi:MAG: hypothetical protein LLG06_04560 [Desulfobacteraceae bacterium]|nr:hypothetical protein [Desulfobacteraceae bacterium]